MHERREVSMVPIGGRGRLLLGNGPALCVYQGHVELTCLIQMVLLCRCSVVGAA
jgi:hypothetical protein